MCAGVVTCASVAGWTDVVTCVGVAGWTGVVTCVGVAGWTGVFSLDFFLHSFSLMTFGQHLVTEKIEKNYMECRRKDRGKTVVRMKCPKELIFDKLPTEQIDFNEFQMILTLISVVNPYIIVLNNPSPPLSLSL